MKYSTDPHVRLAKHLDDLPGGFPPTDSGVELRILRRLFSPDEAELALHVSLIPEEARVIARRAGLGLNEAGLRLSAMGRKGLIFELTQGSGPTQYAAAQFVIGIWEFHLNDLDPELIRDFNEYLPTLAGEALKFPQLRTIPVNRSLAPQLTVLSYEKAEALVARAQETARSPLHLPTRAAHGGGGLQRPRGSLPRV